MPTRFPLTSPRLRILALTFTLTLVLLILYSTGIPDLASSSFRFPSLLPSHSYLSTPYDPELDDLLESLSANLSSVCHDPTPAPVLTHPTLTRAQARRYAHLRNVHARGQEPGSGRYLLASNTRQIQAQLPDLLNTFLVLTTFLGPEKISLSMVEGPSDDCTADALESVLHPMLRSLGVPEHQINLETRVTKVDFETQNRIEVLAGLRNRVLAPLWASDGEGARDIVAIVDFNDVFLSARDVLELLHQHVRAGEESGLETGMTTGMDYLERWPEWYYDVWVGRTVSAESIVRMRD